MMRNLVIGMLVSGSLAFGETAPAAGPQGGLTPLVPILLMLGVFYFLILRPQRKTQKLHQQFLAQLKRGDMVITNAGIIGTVKTLSDKFVTLEVDEGVCLKILRTQILENANKLNEEKGKALEAKPKPA